MTARHYATLAPAALSGGRGGRVRGHCEDLPTPVVDAYWHVSPLDDRWRHTVALTACRTCPLAVPCLSAAIEVPRLRGGAWVTGGATAHVLRELRYRFLRERVPAERIARDYLASVPVPLSGAHGYRHLRAGRMPDCEPLR